MKRKDPVAYAFSGLEAAAQHLRRTIRKQADEYLHKELEACAAIVRKHSCGQNYDCDCKESMAREILLRGTK